MRIHKNNYEAFFLDYYEGTLTPAQVQEPMAFLEQHPYLKEEFENFENISLNEFEDEIRLENKDAMKKDMVNDHNFEEFAIAYAEGRLSAVQEAALLDFVEKNPSFKIQLELYRKTILPVEHVDFVNKDALKKNEDELMPVMSVKETLFISAIEGILTTGQQQQLAALLADETHSREFELYKRTRLSADAQVVFPDRSALKRKEPARVIPLYYYWSAAASIALLIAAYF